MKAFDLMRKAMRSILRGILVCYCFLGVILVPAVQAASPGSPPPAGTVGAPGEAVAPPAKDAATPSAARTLASPASQAEFSPAQRVQEALLSATFSYPSKDISDPFIPFIQPVATAPALPPPEEESDLPPEPQRPLTPLQKMTLAEIEKGLRAITWGSLGRRAVIEDSAGKGYIVSVGTPAGDRNGVITEIFNDRLVIQQEFWDKKLKRMMPQNSVVKLRKMK